LAKNYKQNSKETINSTTSRISVTNSSKLNLDTSQDKNAEVDLMPIAPAKENKLGIEKQPILLLFMQFVYIYQNF